MRKQLPNICKSAKTPEGPGDPSFTLQGRGWGGEEQPASLGSHKCHRHRPELCGLCHRALLRHHRRRNRRAGRPGGRLRPACAVCSGKLSCSMAASWIWTCSMNMHLGICHACGLMLVDSCCSDQCVGQHYSMHTPAGIHPASLSLCQESCRAPQQMTLTASVRPLRLMWRHGRRS